MSKTVLIVDDDRDIVTLIAKSLTLEQFSVIPAHSGKEAMLLLENSIVDFVILDINMPGMDGLEVCRSIRTNHNVPILFLSARDRDMDKIIGLEIGADDYMTKPFSVGELTSRIKAHFRKTDRLYKEWGEVKNAGNGSNTFPLILNGETYEAFLRGEKLDLSTKEFQVLSFLENHPGQVLSREQIYDSVWGDSYGDLNTITVHIKNIRKKLAGYDAIKTIWGVGYKHVIGGGEE